MISWHMLLQSAFVGTRKRPLELSANDPLSEHILAKYGENTASAALHLAAIHSLRRIAGYVPPTLGKIDYGTHPHQYHVGAVNWLHEVFNRYPELNHEYLSLLHSAGLLIPEEALPELLDLALNQGMEDQLEPLIGPRGKWLTQLNPRWAHLFVDEATWQLWRDVDNYPSTLNREAMFARLRRADAKRAVEMLAETWEREQPINQAKLINALWNKLSEDDEPFLERLLDTEINGHLRTRVVSLLTRLPNSAFAARMAERALAHVRLGRVQPPPTARISPKSEAPYCLVAQEPTLQADWARDNFTESLQGGSLLQRTLWRGSYLQRMVGHVPPRRWCEAFGLTPYQLICAAELSGQVSALLSGMLTASQTYCDQDWLMAFFEYAINTDVKRRYVIQPRVVVPYLDHSMREACMTRLFEVSSRPFAVDRMGLGLLDNLTEGWSVSFSRVFLVELRQAARDTELNETWASAPRRSLRNRSRYLQETLGHYARYVALEILPELEAMRQEIAESPHWAAFLDQFCAMLRFRQQMHETFRKDTTVQ